MRTSAALLALLLVGAGAPPVGSHGAAARAVIETVMGDVLGVLRDQTLTQEQKSERIEAIAEARFDFDRISRLVLARNARKLSAEQKEEFLREFKRHLSLTYSRRINRFSDEDVHVGDTQAHSNGDVTVKTTVVGGGADGVTIDYRMRVREGDWYAIDVVIEGVSMIANFRSQIQEIVSASGPDGLIETLRKKNAEDAQAETQQES